MNKRKLYYTNIARVRILKDFLEFEEDLEKQIFIRKRWTNKQEIKLVRRMKWKLSTNLSRLKKFEDLQDDTEYKFRELNTNEKNENAMIVGLLFSIDFNSIKDKLEKYKENFILSELLTDEEKTFIKNVDCKTLPLLKMFLNRYKR